MAYEEYNVKHPFAIVFRYAGTIWPLVLPYCILNCIILIAIMSVTRYYGFRISILPQGHALMSLLIAYLGVSKVNLAFDRYMQCRMAVGNAFTSLRVINQVAIMITENDSSEAARQWRQDTKTYVLQLLQATVIMVTNNKHAQQLTHGIELKQRGDPLEMIHVVRSHLFQVSNDVIKNPQPLQMLERCKLYDTLHEFTLHYRDLLRLASTPLPFALVQMGRTFIFIWVVTIPLVLSGKDFNDDFSSVLMFVVLLTYGYLGLEMVAMKMSNPFGDETKNDLNVKDMAESVMNGINNDSRRLEQGKNPWTAPGETSPKKANDETGPPMLRELRDRRMFESRLLVTPPENMDPAYESRSDQISNMFRNSFQLPPGFTLPVVQLGNPLILDTSIMNGAYAAVKEEKTDVVRSRSAASKKKKDKTTKQDQGETTHPGDDDGGDYC